MPNADKQLLNENGKSSPKLKSPVELFIDFKDREECVCARGIHSVPPAINSLKLNYAPKQSIVEL